VIPTFEQELQARLQAVRRTITAPPPPLTHRPQPEAGAEEGEAEQPRTASSAAAEARAARESAVRACPLASVRGAGPGLVLGLSDGRKRTAGATARAAAATAARALPAPADEEADGPGLGQPPPPPPPPPPPALRPLAPDELVLRLTLFAHGRDSGSVELSCLASSSVESLRDELVRLGCPAEAAAAQFGARRQGAFLYVDGTFYVDQRAGAEGDLSEPLLRHAARAGGLVIVGEGAREAGTLPPAAHAAAGGGPSAAALREGLRSAPMAASPLASLRLRLGATYIFVHQGSCEHMLRFSDVRQPSAAERAAGAAAFPKCERRVARAHRRCTLCEATTASALVSGSPLTPESPCYLCQECFQRLHYSREGALLYPGIEVYDPSIYWT